MATDTIKPPQGFILDPPEGFVIDTPEMATLPAPTPVTPTPQPTTKPLPLNFWQKTKKAWDIGGREADIDFQWRDVKYGKISREQAEKNETEFYKKLKENPLEARNWLENLYLKTVSMAHPMASGQAKGFTYGTMAAGAAAVLGQAGPQAALPEEIVTMPTAFGAGNIIGALTYWAEQGEGSIYRDAIKAGLSDKTASYISSIGGPIYGAIEFSQVDKIIPKLGGFAKKTVLSAITGYLKRIGVEVLEEGEQKIVTEGAVKLLGKALEGKIAVADVPDTVKEIGLSAVREMKEAIGPMALLTLPGGSIDVGKAIITKPQPTKPLGAIPSPESLAAPPVRITEKPPIRPSTVIKPAEGIKLPPKPTGARPEALVVEGKVVPKARTLLKKEIEADIIQNDPIYASEIELIEKQKQEIGAGVLFVPKKFAGEAKLAIGSYPQLRFQITHDPRKGKHWDEFAAEIGLGEADISEILEARGAAIAGRKKIGNIPQVILDKMMASNNPYSEIAALKQTMLHERYNTEEINDNILDIATEYGISTEGLLLEEKPYVEAKQRVLKEVEREKEKAQVPEEVPKDLVGRPILKGGAVGKQAEFLEKEKYRLPEPDIEGQMVIPTKPTKKLIPKGKIPIAAEAVSIADQAETPQVAKISNSFNAPPVDIVTTAKEKEPFPADQFQPELEKLVGHNNWQLEINRIAYEKRTKQLKPNSWKAITLWVQYHNRPQLLAQYEKKATPELTRLINRSRTLSKGELVAAKQLEKEYAADIKMAKEIGVIEGFEENYINQVWDIKKKGRRLFGKHHKFGTKLNESKRRIIKGGYLQGILDAKLEPITLNAAELRRLYKENLTKAINEKVFLDSIRDMALPTGEKLLVPISKVSDWNKYVVVDHPSLMRYTYRGSKIKQTQEGGAFGGISATKETYFEKTPLAVHRSAAVKLRPILERSQLRNTKIIGNMLKFNAMGKYTLLSFSGFHHTALGKTAVFYGLNPLPWGGKGFKAGLDLIENQDPTVRFLVETGGLTLGTSSKLAFARDLSMKGFKAVGEKLGVPGKGVIALKRWWDRGLWDHYFVGLKAVSAKIWFRKVQKLYPNKSRAECAKIAANDINNNYGGLNWELLSVNDTALDWFRLALLAPDWTFSNWRMFFDASKTSTLENLLSEKIKKGKPLGEIEKLLFGGGKHAKGATRYLGRVFFTLGTLTIIANLALWGEPFPQDDDDISRTWWMVKLPYKDEKGRPYYLDIFGHFFEPVKLAASPIRWAAGKRSFLWKGTEEQIKGTNWRGDYIGNLEDLTKGNLYRSKYKDWPDPGLFGWKRMPNRIIHAASAFIPIPMRTAIDIGIGEKKALEAISTTGLYIRKGRKSEKTTVKPRRRAGRPKRKRVTF